MADAKYYSHQLKVNLAFHHPCKSKGDKRRFAWDSSPIYLFVFSLRPSCSPAAFPSRVFHIWMGKELEVDHFKCWYNKTVKTLNGFQHSFTLHADDSALKTSPPLIGYMRSSEQPGPKWECRRDSGEVKSHRLNPLLREFFLLSIVGAHISMSGARRGSVCGFSKAGKRGKQRACLCPRVKNSTFKAPGSHRIWSRRNPAQNPPPQIDKLWIFTLLFRYIDFTKTI